MKHPIFVSVVLLAGLAVSPASAMVACWVKKTPDGFVALRAEPAATGKLVARMKGGDTVLGVDGVKRRGVWWKIHWWKKETHERLQGLVIDKADGVGWVNEKLIEDECG